jgi:hypothetical protein
LQLKWVSALDCGPVAINVVPVADNVVPQSFLVAINSVPKVILIAVSGCFDCGPLHIGLEKEHPLKFEVRNWNFKKEAVSAKVRSAHCRFPVSVIGAKVAATDFFGRKEKYKI